MKESIAKELIDYTLERLDSIEKNYKDASQRGSQYKKVANRIHKKLTAKKKGTLTYSPNTYHSTLTRIRNAIKDTGRKHHGLTSTAKRKGYLSKAIELLPSYESELRALASMPAATVGNGRDQLKQQLHKELNDNDLDHAIEVVDGLLVDHPLVTYLIKSKARREKRAHNETESLSKKSSNVKVYNLPALLRLADENLQSDSYTSVAWALALLTGRRAAEILYHAEFKKSTEDSVMFLGQIKKRAGTHADAYLIPVLADADKIISALNRLRKMPEVAVFHGSEIELDGNTANPSKLRRRDLNRAINQRCSGVLNSRAKRLMNDKSEVFKNTRGIYARYCSDTFRVNDERWSGQNEDIFLKAILGHQSIKEVKHYRQVELKHEVSSDWLKVEEIPKAKDRDKPEAPAKQYWAGYSPIKKLRTRLDEYDADNVEVPVKVKGLDTMRNVSMKSVKAFHDNKLRFWIAENKDLAITQSAIEKNKGHTLSSGTGSVDVRVNRLTFRAWQQVVGAEAIEQYNAGKS